jgi:hypothetical protein
MMTAKMMLLALVLAAPAFAQSVGARQVAQKERIRQGVQSGELTVREAARLRARQAQVNRQIRKDRLDGNGFTAAERAKAHAKLNNRSGAIYSQKHDAQAR